jgi:DNA-binding beta-propeller fold protein YncE
MWVANYGDDSVTKLRASDGANLGTFAARENPIAIAYDGTYIWVVNNSTNRVTKLSTSGSPIQSVPVGSNPVAIAFDGTNIWVVNKGSNNVSRIRASDGTSLDPITVVTSPRAIAFDGKYMWVGSPVQNPQNPSPNLIQLRASDGATGPLSLFSCTPAAMASDGGARIFITCGPITGITIASHSYSVTAGEIGNVRTVDFLPYTPTGIAFDGLNMWVASTTSDDCRGQMDPQPIPCGPPKVVRIDTELNSPLNTWAPQPLVRGSSLVGNAPKGVAFDGTSIWVANSGSNTVSKITFRRPAPETGVKQ